MGIITSLFKKKDPRKPVKGIVPRLKNISTVHFRGIFGCLVPILLLSWQPEKGKNDITVKCLWIWMFWFFLIQPVNIPVVGLIPMFLLPMTGVIPTVEITKCYFNENIGLHVLGGMIHLLINGCGADRRLILWLLCSGDSCQFSAKRLIFKASTAAFFLSIFSNRLIVTSTITQFLTPAFINLQTNTASYRQTEPDYDLMRYIVLNAVQTASAIGSTAITHASLTVLAMRAMWSTHPGKGKEYPDIFNYLQYTCFAFPVAFMMFLFNFVYYMLLINWKVVKPMSGNSMAEMRNLLINHQKALPPSTCYEKLCIFAHFTYLAVCFFRWSDWLSDKGWSSFRTIVPEVPFIKDATVAAIFIICLHVLPRSITVLKYFNAKKIDLPNKAHDYPGIMIGVMSCGIIVFAVTLSLLIPLQKSKRELGTLKPESSIMFWRFVDKNTIYGYILLMGSGVALNSAIRASSLDQAVTSSYGKSITDLSWNTSILVVILLSIILASIMSGVAACCIFLPFVLNMALEGAADPWPKNVYLGSLAVGIGTSLGFTAPFLFTPAYFCHFAGKVPIRRMIKLSIGSIIICAFVLWIALLVWAPFIWDPNNTGIQSVTLAPAAPEEAAPEPPPPAP